MEIEEQSSSNPKGDDFEEERDQSNTNKEQPAVVVFDDFADDYDESRAEKKQSNLLNEGDITCLSGSLVGLKREKVEDLYDIYCNHAHEVGFRVRRSSSKYNVAGVMVQKWMVCSCEGIRKDRTSSSKSEGKNRATCITRTNCKASLKIKLNADGLYEIFFHNTEHNHTLSRSYMHHPQRLADIEKDIVIEDMISSEMRAVDSLRYMGHDVGGEHVKINAIEGGDAQILIDNLYQQGDEDHEFFFRVKLDEDGRLCNIFWRDSRMKDDYLIYGDVVVFDTTYRTNKYNLICAPFVGINNHWKNIMFGCAFITNENAESYEWLFEVFKKSMENQSPVTLFTYPDQAIENAIEKNFPTVRHRLCIRHLYQNGVNDFEKLKSDKCFNDAFQKCLIGCIDGGEFEDCWSSMISIYGLQDNSWFKRLYDLRHKWSNVYNKDFFSAGILSSRRSESMNTTIGFNAKETTSLNELYIIFKKIVERWRSNEADDELQCSRENPTSCLPLTGFLKHASEVYTLAIFKDFEKEFLKSISTSISFLSEEHDVKFYHVTEADGITSYQVNFNVTDFLVSCTCKRFEECGLFCCHCLRIMHAHSIPQIPECYIKRRWTKFAKQDLWDKSTSGTGRFEKGQNSATWRQHMVKKFYDLVVKAQENEEARAIVEDGLNGMISAVEALKTTWQTRDVTEETEVSSSSYDELDPSHSITKGRKQRIDHLQKSKKKKTSDASNSNQSKEEWLQNS
ncbi:protein FAR1-RELATED SEQUENCE 5-like [Salvia miltiorrhiza]|uniref:protein FAR1-RELATED SEQUENCE 5-like n=1 Tax=Salvia miltiorrhiza TaxID=226208 RepID=UPI0025ACD0D3|nr:protein FAR1-RELATED SEQUENCE 5-like [Salvia miltiorrhiza]XP_057767245.1 protein FAR1-RELATED SEQUENCE 5-like [Salvia miltiorrhiza]XP_057767246.1 protein FAR1-RELATED SEQUENCE 5-like [Salvia miltiorrhiza]XP_057767247.1 protein FAR1-RELATED SEQUENCE 5-like [Salvia miltiorrhiza]XP_057767248.1 protein FAR1-RELATED SEQUENCE 5-like [Salvia miltiorrhiza]